jgi:hypothetical protein
MMRHVLTVMSNDKRDTMTNETLQEGLGLMLLIVLAYPLAVLVFAL